MDAAPSPTPDRRIRAVVHGGVQGVGFRWATAEHGTEIGASGWVKNEPDGTVVAEVQGTPAQVADMLEFLHRGSQFARVDRVEHEEIPPNDGTGFIIR